MAYNTVPIKKDVDNKPIPQYFNPLQDAYEVLQGRNGANRVELFDANGNPVDLVGLITTIIDILNEKNLPTGASTAAKQDVIINAIDELETLLTAIKDTAGIKKITDALPAGTNNIGKVTIDGSTMEYYGKSTDTKPTDIKVGATFFEIDTKEVYIFDGESWVVI